MSKPMTKTQLVAALSEAMGADKKTAGTALDAIAAIVAREVAAGPWQGRLPRPPGTSGAQPGHRRNRDQAGRQAGEIHHRESAERQRERLIGPAPFAKAAREAAFFLRPSFARIAP
jgi:hypothetical protein